MFLKVQYLGHPLPEVTNVFRKVKKVEKNFTHSHLRKTKHTLYRTIAVAYIKDYSRVAYCYKCIFHPLL